MAKKKTNLKLDTMSITVLLIMSIFGGLIGFYLGTGAMSPQAVSLREAGMLMKEKGILMEEVGKLMDQRGKRWGDYEVIEKAKKMIESGTMLSGKGTGIMGITR
jgi:hypothetical protein